MPRSADELLAQFWARVAVQRRPITRDQLRTVAWQVSLRAHEVGLRPEELIVGVKRSWHLRRDQLDSGQSYQNSWLLTEMISLCIEEFFRRQRDVAESPGIEVP